MRWLERFREAQNSASAGFDTALDELRTGGKRTHWIWYIFPQLDGLGVSSPSRTFALSGVEEAAEFLRDAQLRSRLLTIAGEVRDELRARRATSIGALMIGAFTLRRVDS